MENLREYSVGDRAVIYSVKFENSVPYINYVNDCIITSEDIVESTYTVFVMDDKGHYISEMTFNNNDSPNLTNGTKEVTFADEDKDIFYELLHSKDEAPFFEEYIQNFWWLSRFCDSHFVDYFLYNDEVSLSQLKGIREILDRSKSV